MLPSEYEIFKRIADNTKRIADSLEQTQEPKRNKDKPWKNCDCRTWPCPHADEIYPDKEPERKQESFCACGEEEVDGKCPLEPTEKEPECEHEWARYDSPMGISDIRCKKCYVSRSVEKPSKKECEHRWTYENYKSDSEICSKCGLYKPAIKKDELAELMIRETGSNPKSEAPYRFAEIARKWAVEVVESFQGQGFSTFGAYQEQLLARLKESK